MAKKVEQQPLTSIVKMMPDRQPPVENSSMLFAARMNSFAGKVDGVANVSQAIRDPGSSEIIDVNGLEVGSVVYGIMNQLVQLMDQHPGFTPGVIREKLDTSLKRDALEKLSSGTDAAVEAFSRIMVQVPKDEEVFYGRMLNVEATYAELQTRIHAELNRDTTIGKK